MATNTRDLKLAIKDIESLSESALLEISAVVRLILTLPNQPEIVTHALRGVWTRTEETQMAIAEITGELQ